ncbi:MAG TPA: hypothetical protein VNH40_02205 [Gaiellaceae bacterium]|nr:hypothetical protein [Gaiellaceae bacterium]
MGYRRRLVLASVFPVAAFSLLAAGCGNGGSPRVANVPSSTTVATTPATADSGLLAFSRCMRAHGVPTFPDPQRFVGGNVKLTIHHLVPPQAALSACNHLLPTNGGSGSQETAQQRRTRLADELSFARCMRSHGVSRFPDPSPQAGLTVEMVQAQGIDVRSPAVLRVVQACLPAAHGALTPEKVREALDNVH